MKNQFLKSAAANFAIAIAFAIALVVLAGAPMAMAVEFTFRSKLDLFTVEVTDQGASFEGQRVSLEPFAFIKPLFDAEPIETCASKMPRADLTITRKRGDTEVRRMVYIEKKIISDGTNCAAVTGHGLYQLPLHRNWFQEKKKFTIGLGDEFSIWKNGRQVVAFKKQDGRWQNKDTQIFTNWSFFEKFVDTVKDFPIDFRAHTAAAKDFSKFELRQGSRTFLFVKVGESTWAVQFPGSPWLAASGRFGLFQDMDQRIWISPFEAQLKVAKDKTLPEDKRITAVRLLNSSWGPDAKYLFHDVLLTGGDNANVKREIVSFLRSRPTDENYRVIVDSLKVTEDGVYREAATKVLRLRHPKGATVFANDEDDVAEKKLADWYRWGKALK